MDKALCARLLALPDPLQSVDPQAIVVSPDAELAQVDRKTLDVSGWTPAQKSRFLARLLAANAAIHFSQANGVGGHFEAGAWVLEAGETQIGPKHYEWRKRIADVVEISIHDLGGAENEWCQTSGARMKWALEDLAGFNGHYFSLTDSSVDAATRMAFLKALTRSAQTFILEYNSQHPDLLMGPPDRVLARIVRVDETQGIAVLRVEQADAFSHGQNFQETVPLDGLYSIKLPVPGEDLDRYID